MSDQPPVHAPSATRTQDEFAQVMVDVWGQRGEFTRGQIVRQSTMPPETNWDDMVRRGVVRLLTEAELRSQPTTTVLNADGSVDEDHRRRMRFHAGIPETQPRTISPGQGPVEPAEFSKSGDQAG